jgi:hypothetical protein
MSVKRAPFRLEPDLVERAKTMRRSGASMREIERTIGCSRSSLKDHFADDPSLAVGPPAAIEAEAGELALKVNGIVDNAATILNGLLADLARKAKGEPGSPYVGAREIREVRATITELRRLVELLQGRPTSRTASVAEPEPSAEERAEMDRLARLVAGA